MTERKIILVDMDGVLTNYELGFLDEWRKRHPEKMSIAVEERKTFYARDQYPAEYKQLMHEITASKGFYLNLPIIDGAREGIEKLAREHEVRICTAPISDYRNCVAEKLEWSERELGKEWPMKTIIAKDKTFVFGHYLIDDRPNAEVGGKMKPFWQQVLYKQPYNNGDFTWDKVDKFLERIRREK